MNKSRAVWLMRFVCFQHSPPVRVEMRTREPDDAVWRAAARKGIECPQCGKSMGVAEQERRVGKRELL